MPVTHFIWDRVSDNVLSEVDDAGVETVRYMNEPDQFGNLLSQRRSGTNSFFHFDAQGSTRHLTNDAETVTDSYTYTSFGEPITSSGSTTNPFQYYGTWGYYSDGETGEVYIRARYYDPTTGEFTSRDPLEYVDGMSLMRGYMGFPYLDPLGSKSVATSNIDSLKTTNRSTQEEQETCTFKVCQSPVVGGAAGHLFIICGGDRYRAGPGRNPKDDAEVGRGVDDCECRTRKYGQLWPDIDPWDDKPLDHPENPDAPYDVNDMKCVTMKVVGKCDDVCGCFRKVAVALTKCCIPYKPVPGIDGLVLGGNSNSFVAWSLTTCIAPVDGFGVLTLPGGTRPNPGIWKPRPDCIKDKLNE